MNAKLNMVMPDELKKRLDALAKELGVSVASLVNKMVRENLDMSRFEQIEDRLSRLENEVEELKKKQKP